MLVIFYLPNLGEGGAQRAALNLLKNLDRSKFSLHLVLARAEGPNMDQIPADLPVSELGLSSRDPLWKYVSRLKKLMNTLRPDMVVSFLNQANVPILFAWLMGGKRFRLIISVRNNLTRKFSDRAHLRRWGKKWIVRWIYPQADHIVTVSEGVKHDLCDKFGLPAHKITTIHNPLDVETIRKLAQSDLAGPGLVEGQKLLVAAGRLVEQKGFPDLLRAFAKIHLTYPSRLVILGEGPLRLQLQRLIDELGLSSDVLMPGYVRNPWSYMARSDVFVLSSHWEGLPAVIIEAMACGAPIVATDCDFGPREYITHGVNGILVPVGDVERLASDIIGLLCDQEAAERLGEAGRKRAEDFHQASITTRFEDLFMRCYVDQNSSLAD